MDAWSLNIYSEKRDINGRHSVTPTGRTATVAGAPGALQRSTAPGAHRRGCCSLHAWRVRSSHASPEACWRARLVSSPARDTWAHDPDSHSETRLNPTGEPSARQTLAIWSGYSLSQQLRLPV